MASVAQNPPRDVGMACPHCWRRIYLELLTGADLADLVVCPSCCCLWRRGGYLVATGTWCRWSSLPAPWQRTYDEFGAPTSVACLAGSHERCPSDDLQCACPHHREGRFPVMPLELRLRRYLEKVGDLETDSRVLQAMLAERERQGQEARGPHPDPLFPSQDEPPTPEP